MLQSLGHLKYMGNLRHAFFDHVRRIFMLLFLLLPFMSKGQQEEKSDSLKKIELELVQIYGLQKLSGTMVALNRKELQSLSSNSLGDALSRIPGVQNAAYGPFSGTPQIRSLSGNRVRILSDDLASNDLAGISPNFNFPVDMENVERIQVYKADAAVRYGGKAIGGAINIENSIIPREMDSEMLSGGLFLEASTNNGNRQAINLKVNNRKNWAFHFSGNRLQIDQIRIPGNPKPAFVYDPMFIGFDTFLQGMAQMKVQSGYLPNVTVYPYLSQPVLDALKDPNAEISPADQYSFEPTYYDRVDQIDKPNPKNPQFIAGQDPKTATRFPYVESIADLVPVQQYILPNSHALRSGFSVGTSYMQKDFYIGLGIQASNNRQGIPAFGTFGPTKIVHDDGQGHRHAHTDPDLKFAPINMENTNQRFQLESFYDWKQFGIEKVKFKLSSQFSSDAELLGQQLANQFNSSNQALRFEVEQQGTAMWSGYSGLEANRIQILGKGPLRYMPNTLSRETSLFTMQQIQYAIVQVGAGYRYERVNRQVLSDPSYVRGRGMSGGNLSPRDFQLHQFNSSLQVQLLPFLRVEGYFQHAERAPNSNELYAGNSHFAILTEENGDDRLDKEMANSLDFKVVGKWNNLQISAAFYQQDFKNYLYLAHTGMSRDLGFAIKEWRAADTRIYGYEGMINYVMTFNRQHVWQLDGYFDWVKNEDRSKADLRLFAEGAYMPNLPTSRYGFSMNARYKKFSWQLALDRYLKQKFLGKNINPEPAMPAYSMMNMRITYHGQMLNRKITYELGGNNLFNQEARPQNSFLKYVAPLPGINFSFGIRANI